MSLTIVDRREHTASVFLTRGGPRGPRHIFSRGNRRARRNVTNIDAIILHQTGPGFISASVERFDYVIANYAVMSDGTILFLRDLEMALNSVGTSHRGIDIELAGNYPPVRELRDRRRREPFSEAHRVGDPPRDQLLAARELIDHLKRQHAVTKIFAHAQFSAKNCPGPQFWYNLGGWAQRERHMISTGNGAGPIPRGWNDAELCWVNTGHVIEGSMAPLPRSGGLH